MSDHQPSDPAKVKRLQRLEEQLKENLRRRKSQARSRREAPPEGGQNSIPPADPSRTGVCED